MKPRISHENAMLLKYWLSCQWILLDGIMCLDLGCFEDKFGHLCRIIYKAIINNE